jgi:transcriptional regulator with XRE-family HTH domain
VPPKRLGMRIKELRKARGWTQATLAAKVGITRIHLANIESPHDASHHRTPSLTTLEKLAKALGATVADLLKP